MFKTIQVLNVFIFIILESKKIRQLFEAVDKRVNDIEKQIFGLQKSISKNFGPENEFLALDGQCYKLIDHVYIYELCLFEKVNIHFEINFNLQSQQVELKQTLFFQITQRSKMDGLEVNLGVWNGWTKFVDTIEHKYHTMLYDKGHNCSNHFQRFTYVSIISF